MGSSRIFAWRTPQRPLGCPGGWLALALLCSRCSPFAHAAPPAASRTTRAAATRPHAAAITPWEAAERARDAFEASPEATRTRADYSRVMDRFRAIYHDNPRDAHAPEAINAVAELLAEEGRDLHEPRSYQAAVGQYEFLRTQYPTSSLRVGALLAEGQLEENELRNPAAARERYDLLLKQYPRSALADQARAGLASLTTHGRRATATVAAAGTPPAGAKDSRRGANATEPQSSSPDRQNSSARLTAADRVMTGVAGTSSVTNGASVGDRASTQGSASVLALPPPRQIAHRSGPLASVSGIRHWSTSSYTRVAIDLGEEVEYEAARVPSPDRIFFDLHGARLASDLVGKSFAVTDDGFLKRIRVAQSAPDVARVVLDVNEVSEYSAFLLPNPTRLIIDIHGRPKAAAAQQLASVDSPAPRTATVPNTRAMHAGSATDVNTLSDQPGKVEATSTPTSQPIAATVPGRDAAAAPDGSAAAAGTAHELPPTSSTSGRASHAQASAGSTGTVLSSTPAAAAGPDARVVGDSAPVATERAVAATLAAGKKGKRGSKAVNPADARVAGDPATPARAATRTADGQTSLVRALGLKINRIVIDAGHGGHDSGTLGVDGLEEKDVVLDVALRLGKLLKERLGAEVTYTRSDDTFIPLETRTAIANKAQADLFLSIHANSSPDASARGVETYYLNFTQQADALEVAARENAVSGQSIHQLSDLVRKITLKDKIAESREFATDVEGSLYGGLAHGNEGLKNRGVKKAPFVVLIGANMPSILAEISFLTNPHDAAQLREADYKQRVAESLYKGIARYVGSLSNATPSAPMTERASTGQ